MTNIFSHGLNQEKKQPTMPDSRKETKAITGHFDPAVRQQLAIIAAEQQKTQNTLLGEALNLLFEKYHKNPIA